MDTRWKVFNLYSTEDPCLSQIGPTNGPYNMTPADWIDSRTYLSIIVPLHIIIRRGTVNNPTYITMTGDTYSANYYGNWGIDLGVTFGARGVDADDNPLIDGVVTVFSGGATIEFAPMFSTEIWGLEFYLVQTPAPDFTKASSILEFGVHTGNQYTIISTSPDVWNYGVGSEIDVYDYDVTDIGSGILETRTARPGPLYIQKTKVDIWPAMSLGTLYYLETQVGQNVVFNPSGWTYQDGPPPPDGTGENYVFGLQSAYYGGYVFAGSSEEWDTDHFEMVDQYSSSSPTWLKHYDKVGNYARVFFTAPGPAETELSVFGGGRGTGLEWYVKTDQLLESDFGLADQATKYKVEVDELDVYNYCSP